MIVDACRRLVTIEAFGPYQYVGFGGLEFGDFVDFHNALDLQTMTSIERDTYSEPRLAINKPYDTIRMLMGEATDQLPLIDWSIHSIVWLDYTCQLTEDVLHAVDFVVREAKPGSVVIVTVNGAASLPLAKRLDNLKASLPNLVSDELTEDDMEGWGATTVERRILQAAAHTASREAHGMPLRQLFNFHYADGAKMLTWGGIVTSSEVDTLIDSCRFADLNFVREGDDPFELNVPEFTEREMEHLVGKIAGNSKPLPKVAGFKEHEVNAFADIYRWRGINR